MARALELLSVSAPQGRMRGAAASDDEAVSLIGQSVWFVDQIEPVGTVQSTINMDDRVVGFVLERPHAPGAAPVVHRVQANRIRKYGDRYFLVTAWFAKADHAAKELERMLAKGLAP